MVDVPSTHESRTVTLDPFDHAVAVREEQACAMRDDREQLRAGGRSAIFEVGCSRGFGVGRGGDWVNLQGTFTVVLTAGE